MQPFLYLRGLKHADATVFAVQDGQKTYFDVQHNRRMAFSSGQQVKRSIMDTFLATLDVQPAPITFVSVLSVKSGKTELGEGEPLSLCDPSYPDQLIGGYMRAEGGGANRTLKRRSPLSISAMRPLHPFLAGVYSENITYDRTDRPELHNVIVRDSSGNKMSDEDIVTLLAGKDRSLLRKWIPENKRTGGLFVYDVAVDLRRLFTVPTNQFEPEVSPDTIGKLRSQGWTDGKTVFGNCLVAPPELRDSITRALAHALLNWQITSNQARTFSLMETLAVAVSDNASKIAGAIRADLDEDGKEKAEPKVEQSMSGVDTFVTFAASGYIRDVVKDMEALDKAEAKLIERIKAYTDTL